MRFVLAGIAVVLAGTAAASPHGGSGGWEHSGHAHDGSGTKACLSSKEATEIVSIYQQLIASYTAPLGEKYCADGFVDRSDSINTFLQQPLGAPTFATKAIFMAAQAANPPLPLVVDSIDAVDCRAIGLRWHAAFGEANQPVRGISILKTTKEKGWWQIAELDVEFNSLVWLLDMGGNYTLAG